MKYCIGYDEFPYTITFVTGASRSGKSLFSRLMSTAENIEWLFEPYAVYMPAVLASIGQLDIQIATGMMRDACRELIHDRILLRNANFRPKDVSSIYRYKDAKTIFNRLYQLESHDDVDAYITKRHVNFILDIPKHSCPIDVMREAFPAAKFIHIVRNGFSVAKATEQKGWFDLEHINKKKEHGIAYRKSCMASKQFVPYWLPKEKEQEFISTTNYGRGVIYWDCQLQNIQTKQEWLTAEIKYEDMVVKPQVVLDKAEGLFSPTWTAQTYAVVSEFYKDECVGEVQSLQELSEREQLFFYRQMRRYGYEN